MRTTSSYLYACLVWLTAAVVAQADHGIELSLSRSACYPGDVVELHAEMSRPDFAQFNLKLPRNNALHLVAQENSPVSYHDGVYTQQSTWVMQPTSAGTIEIKGIIAVLTQGETVTEFELSAPTLVVSSYAESEDSFTPEPLPPTQSIAASFSILFLLSLALGSVMLLIIVFRKNPDIGDSAAETVPTLDDVRTALESGKVPTALIESMLADADASLPRPTRELLERAVYSKSTNAKALLQLLTEEIAS